MHADGREELSWYLSELQTILLSLFVLGNMHTRSRDMAHIQNRATVRICNYKNMTQFIIWIITRNLNLGVNWDKTFSFTLVLGIEINSQHSLVTQLESHTT